MPPLNLGLWPGSAVDSCGRNGGAGKPKLLQASCLDHSMCLCGLLVPGLGDSKPYPTVWSHSGGFFNLEIAMVSAELFQNRSQAAV